MYRFGLPTVLATVMMASSLLAGCEGGDGGEETVPTSSSSTTASGVDCPGGGAVPPEGAENVSEVSADVDGDGADDRVLAYRHNGDRRVAVELTGGGTDAVDANASEIVEPAPLSVLGGVALGGDGETVFAVTGAGASVVIVGLFQFVECALTRVSFESGQAVELPVSGAITHGDGLRCAPGGDGPPLVRLSATSTDGESFTATETGYRVDGNILVEVDTQTTTLTRGADDKAINAYYILDCPNLEHGVGSL